MDADSTGVDGEPERSPNRPRRDEATGQPPASGATSPPDSRSRSGGVDPFGVGEFIRQRREMAEMSVRRLAELADVSNPYLSQIERGLRKPSAEILQQIASALKVSVETLYVKAGFLPDSGRSVSTVPEAIAADPDLSDEQKRALLSVYESFLAD